jgi:hypothetical protein
MLNNNENIIISEGGIEPFTEFLGIIKGSPVEWVEYDEHQFPVRDITIKFRDGEKHTFKAEICVTVSPTEE